MTTPNVKRKPVPVSNGHVSTTINAEFDPPPPLPNKNEYDVNVSEDDDGESGFKPLPALPPAPAMASSSSYLFRARNHWQRTSRRRRWLYIAVPLFLFLLALIVGLAVGLTHKKSTEKYDYAAPTHTGDLTYYDPGLGACGVTSTSSDFICALSYHLFDSASTSANPNANPLCGRKLWFMLQDAGSGGERVEVTVVDRCAGCQGAGDLDVSETAFEKVAPAAEGRVGIEWGWID
jgi:hypothetical protein